MHEEKPNLRQYVSKLQYADVITLVHFNNLTFLIFSPIAEMAEGNGEILDDMANIKSEDRGDGEKTEDYPKLLE